MSNARQIRKELFEIALLIVFGIALTAVFGYIRSPRQFWIIGSFTALMWVLLWKGNSYISHAISKYVDWLKTPLKSFALLSLGTIVYTISIMFLLMQVYKFSFGVDFGDSEEMLYSTVIVTIIISLFMHGRSFLINWRQAAIDAEKLKKESVIARYDSLKNQVNPHFLFNSLNTLTHLVYEDQDKSVKFIKQLSEVYRYVLDTRDKEVVSIEEELKFLNSYLFLQQIRFGNKLRIKNLLDDVHGFIPPLALQMLLENAIKHNVISEEHPLEIEIFREGESIVVRNNLQKKSKISGDSSGVGLENIRRRYEFISNQPLEVADSGGYFLVKLPLLTESI